MKVLLDECLPKRLKLELFPHEVTTVQERGWSSKENGELLRVAQPEFDVFLTIDQNLKDQQNLSKFKISIITLKSKSNSFESISPFLGKIKETLKSIKPGTLVKVA